MIVTCEECTTSFKLDETRIPPSGARVRCSRCKHAFFLPHPSASGSDAVHSIAEESAASPEAPPATDDLVAAPTHGLPPATPLEPEPELDEEEWQFSEEVRVEGDDLTDPGLSIGDFGEGAPIGDGLVASGLDESQVEGIGSDESALASAVSPDDLEMPGSDDMPAVAADAAEDSGLASGLELDAPQVASEIPRDDSDFGSVDDFSALMEDEEPATVEGLEEEEAPSAEAVAAAPAPVGTYAETGPTDDLGDPESWDLVGQDDDAIARNAVMQKGRRPLGQSGGIGSVDAREFFSDTGFEGAAYEAERGALTRVLRPIAFVGKGLGWVVSLGLVAAVCFYGSQAERVRWVPTQQSVVMGALRAETVSSGWVSTARSGGVLRFFGEVRNTGRQAIWPGVVQLALLGADGERLATPPVVAGAPMPTRVLREAAPDVLSSTARAAAHRFGATPLAPGEVRGFEAVLLEADLPVAARRFQLELAERPRPRPRSTGPAAPAPASTPPTPTADGATEDMPSGASGDAQ